MKVFQQTWNDLLMTPSVQSVTGDKYTDNGVCVYRKKFSFMYVSILFRMVK